MQIVRILLIATVVLVGTSEAIFLKKALLAKTAAVKVGFVKDVKAAALHFKAGVALQKKALFGGLKAVGKAKLGFLAGIKAAKIGVLKSIATAKLAKVAAIKAGKLAFVKTLVAAKLAPIIIKKVGIGSAILGKGAIAGGALKGAAAGGAVKGSIPAFLPFAAEGNPLIDLVTGAISQAQSFAGNINLPGILSNVGGASGFPQFFPPPSQPSVNIETYKPDEIPARNYAPAAPPPSYGPPAYEPPSSYGPPPAPAISYGPPPAPATSYGPPPAPATSYGVPGYY